MAIGEGGVVLVNVVNHVVVDMNKELVHVTILLLPMVGLLVKECLTKKDLVMFRLAQVRDFSV